MKILTKKINNKFIFYDKDIEINIEELFRSGVFDSNEASNVEWINDSQWVKKHYFRKGMMSFMSDNYLYRPLIETRSYQEFSLLSFLYNSRFNTCRPIMGWVDYNYFTYKANLVTESINSATFNDFLIFIDNNLSDNLIKLKYKVFENLGILVARMHKLGVNHGDLNISNILINEKLWNNNYDNNIKDNIWIIDFDKSKKNDSLLKKSHRYINIERLKRSLLKTSHYDSKSFNFFLQGYQSRIRD